MQSISHNQFQELSKSQNNMSYGNEYNNSKSYETQYNKVWDSLGIPEIIYNDQWRFEMDRKISNSYPSSYDSEFIPPHKVYSEVNSEVMAFQEYEEYIQQDEIDSIHSLHSIQMEDEELFFQMSPSLSSLPSPISTVGSPRKTSLKAIKSPKRKEYKDGKCFPCDMCSSTFSRNHDLKRHVR